MECQTDRQSERGERGEREREREDSDRETDTWRATTLENKGLIAATVPAL